VTGGWRHSRRAATFEAAKGEFYPSINISAPVGAEPPSPSSVPRSAIPAFGPALRLPSSTAGICAPISPRRTPITILRSSSTNRRWSKLARGGGPVGVAALGRRSAYSLDSARERAQAYGSRSRATAPASGSYLQVLAADAPLLEQQGLQANCARRTGIFHQFMRALGGGFDDAKRHGCVLIGISKMPNWSF
jgi:outer membrane protein TolC